MSLQTKFTDPIAVNADTLTKRCYVTFYFDHQRIREYHGKSIGLTINPNRAKTILERQQQLKKLVFEFHKALENGNYPISGHGKADNPSASSGILNIIQSPVHLSTIEMLFNVMKTKLRSNLSKKYKRNLKTVYRQFRAFLTETELKNSVTLISTVRIESFLSQFKTSGTYYMNKRRDLGVLISAAGRFLDSEISIVKQSQKKKSHAKLHKPYERSQIKPILKFLKRNNSNLHLCCLLTYGAWLRPHEEVRLLTRVDFKKNDTEIHLSGGYNKGGKVRVVYVPEYVQEVLKPILVSLSRNDNIFSLTSEPFNESYFNTAWGRAYKKMYALGLVYEDQTIYSFRHTAAIEVYRRTKDVYLLQKLLGHSTIVVTLKYLRSLGEFNSDELRDAAPQLE